MDVGVRIMGMARSWLAIVSGVFAVIAAMITLISLQVRASSGLGTALLRLCGFGLAAQFWVLGLLLLLIALARTYWGITRRREPIIAAILLATTALGAVAVTYWPTSNRLVNAARFGEVKRVDRYLALGVDPNTPQQVQPGFGGPVGPGMTPLTAASYGGHDNIVRSLLNAGAQIDQPDGEGKTPLEAAVVGGHPTTLKLLLQQHAIPVLDDPDDAAKVISSIWPYGLTPAENVRRANALSILDVLIQHGASLESPALHLDAMRRLDRSTAVALAQRRIDGVGRGLSANPSTDLLNAIALGDDAWAMQILDTHAQLLVTGAGKLDALTTLELSAKFGVLPVAQTMMQQINGLKPERLVQALLNASEGGFIPIMLMLLDHDVPVGDPHGERESPLHHAALTGQIDAMELLIARGADVNAGVTASPLDWAVRRGEKDAVLLLLDHGADPNGKFSAYRHFALADAAEAGDVDLVRILFKAGGVARLSSYKQRQTLEAAGLNTAQIEQIEQAANQLRHQSNSSP